MIIKPVLCITAVLILIWFLRKQGPTLANIGKNLGSIILFGMAIVAIVLPNTTNHIAHLLGVGRGADLLLYVLTLCFIGSLAGQSMRNRDEKTELVKLSRRIAIDEANFNESNQEKIKKVFS